MRQDENRLRQETEITIVLTVMVRFYQIGILRTQQKNMLSFYSLILPLHL